VCSPFHRLIDDLLPYSRIKTPNPIFEQELNRLNAPRDGTVLMRRASRFIFRLTALTVILVITLYGLFITMYGSSPSTFISPLRFIVFISLAVMIVANFIYVAITARGLSYEIMSGQWDLLVITPQNEGNLIAAKFAAAQIQMWRLVSVEIALRIASVGIAGLEFLTYWLKFSLDARTYALLICLILIIPFYVLEPLWRMPAVVAWGLAIGIQAKDVNAAMLNALIMVLDLSLNQSLIVGIVWYILVPLADSVDILFCGFPLGCLATGYIIRRLYKTVEQRALKRAMSKPWYHLPGTES
jgi:hypothetical protein